MRIHIETVLTRDALLNATEVLWEDGLLGLRNVPQSPVTYYSEAAVIAFDKRVLSILQHEATAMDMSLTAVQLASLIKLTYAYWERPRHIFQRTVEVRGKPKNYSYYIDVVTAITATTDTDMVWVEYETYDEKRTKDRVPYALELYTSSDSFPISWFDTMRQGASLDIRTGLLLGIEGAELARLVFNKASPTATLDPQTQFDL